MPKHQTHNLIIVAHPDDESIFFAGLILSKPKTKWHVICVTNGDGDGRKVQRAQELKRACKKLKIEYFEQWDFPDRFNERLNTQELSLALRNYKLRFGKSIKTVYTHNPIGEYGHPHHQDVCWSVYQNFSARQIWTVAYNCYASKIVYLSKAHYKIKQNILCDIYQRETLRFLNLLPCTATEGFVQQKLSSVEQIYSWLVTKRPPKNASIAPFEGISAILAESPYLAVERPF